MDPSQVFSKEEVARLRELARGGRTLNCPRCGDELDPRPVAAPSEVSYVRHRVWWICSRCRRSLVIDRDRGPLRSIHQLDTGEPTLGGREQDESRKRPDVVGEESEAGPVEEP